MGKNRRRGREKEITTRGGKSIEKTKWGKIFLEYFRRTTSGEKG